MAAHGPDSTLEAILDQARWAPSGDNTQPWRFEILGQRHVAVHGFDTRDHCVYDLDGHSSQLALGALLETMSIAATRHALVTSFERRGGTPDTHPVFDVYFADAPEHAPDPLNEFITERSVQRRPFSMRSLQPAEKLRLEQALEPGYRVVWLEGLRMRFQAALLMFANAKLRLTMPEAYRVHRDIIAWNASFSEDKVPDQALGLDAMTLRIMRWVMQSWERVEFFNTYLAGTWAPRIQMDLIPGIACAGHFIVLAKHPPAELGDYVTAGRAVQRFWLTATQYKLLLQPELTPLIFSRYVRRGLAFTEEKHLIGLAKRLSQKAENLIGLPDIERAVFVGRIGSGKAPFARSLRLPLPKLSHE